MQRTTILLVTPEQTHRLHIDARLLRWHRPLLIALLAATVLLSFALGAVGWNYLRDTWTNSQEISQLRQQVTDLQHFTSAEIQAKLKALQQSERMVTDVQKYLQARGVQVKPVSAEPPPGRPNPAAGGATVNMARPVPYTHTFAKDTENLLQAVQNIPLGLPHEGALSSRFGGRANPFTGAGHEQHEGLDFKGNHGDPVRATARGQVVSAGWNGGYGHCVIVSHGNGYTTLYGHLSQISVRPGQQLQPGDQVGLLGSSGRSTGPHLHYEVQRNGQRVDPERYLSLADIPLSPDLNQP